MEKLINTLKSAVLGNYDTFNKAENMLKTHSSRFTIAEDITSKWNVDCHKVFFTYIIWLGMNIC